LPHGIYAGGNTRDHLVGPVSKSMQRTAIEGFGIGHQPSTLTTTQVMFIRLGLLPGELPGLAHQPFNQSLRADPFCTAFSDRLNGPLIAEHLF